MLYLFPIIKFYSIWYVVPCAQHPIVSLYKTNVEKSKMIKLCKFAAL